MEALQATTANTTKAIRRGRRDVHMFFFRLTLIAVHNKTKVNLVHFKQKKTHGAGVLSAQYCFLAHTLFDVLGTSFPRRHHASTHETRATQLCHNNAIMNRGRSNTRRDATYDDVTDTPHKSPKTSAQKLFSTKNNKRCSTRSAGSGAICRVFFNECRFRNANLFPSHP